jgi:hypothetical protein
LSRSGNNNHSRHWDSYFCLDETLKIVSCESASPNYLLIGTNSVCEIFKKYFASIRQQRCNRDNSSGLLKNVLSPLELLVKRFLVQIIRIRFSKISSYLVLIQQKDKSKRFIISNWFSKNMTFVINSWFWLSEILKNIYIPLDLISFLVGCFFLLLYAKSATSNDL